MPTGSASEPNPPSRRLAGFMWFVGVLLLCVAVLAWKYRPHSVSYEYALRVVAGDTLAGSIDGDVTGTLTWSRQRYPFTSRVTRVSTVKSALTSPGSEVAVKLRPDGYSYRHAFSRRDGTDFEWEGRPARGVTVIQVDTLYTFGRPEGRVTALPCRPSADPQPAAQPRVRDAGPGPHRSRRRLRGQRDGFRGQPPRGLSCSRRRRARSCCGFRCNAASKSRTAC